MEFQFIVKNCWKVTIIVCPIRRVAPTLFPPQGGSHWLINITIKIFTGKYFSSSLQPGAGQHGELGHPARRLGEVADLPGSEREAAGQDRLVPRGGEDSRPR